jgi:regulator of protease activity HflC (stomatin/prohibitin superfamily)
MHLNNEPRTGEREQGDEMRPTRGAPVSYLDLLERADGGAGLKSSAQYFGTALGVGFRLVRVLMLLLGVLFLFSNVYWVPEGTVAIQTRFGRIVGGRRAVVRGPGGPHWALPHPIERVTRIPSTVQHLSIQRPFHGEKLWTELSGRGNAGTASLVPGRDGSLVTGDQNLVQGTWDVRYRLDYTPGESAPGVADFARNVGSMALASNLVQRETEAAVVRIVAGTSVG